MTTKKGVMLMILGLAFLAVAATIGMEEQLNHYKIIQTHCEAINYTLEECTCYRPDATCTYASLIRPSALCAILGLVFIAFSMLEIVDEVDKK